MSRPDFDTNDTVDGVPLFELYARLIAPEPVFDAAVRTREKLLMCCKINGFIGGVESIAVLFEEAKNAAAFSDAAGAVMYRTASQHALQFFADESSLAPPVKLEPPSCEDLELHINELLDSNELFWGSFSSTLKEAAGSRGDNIDLAIVRKLDTGANWFKTLHTTMGESFGELMKQYSTALVREEEEVAEYLRVSETLNQLEAYLPHANEFHSEFIKDLLGGKLKAGVLVGNVYSLLVKRVQHEAYADIAAGRRFSKLTCSILQRLARGGAPDIVVEMHRTTIRALEIAGGL